ncbi:hypothetical protein GCM10011581_42160 [Saccharopolyspora subtropica]|uniref:Uncharacterized protein n=1 Tax=Saccharopolyspora thermophila TaxID=89367 RepID=A0A917K4L5_9PSEU|nr:hypothetical protein [Saccharopolyspora subtropica]GGJ00586.1 hypothetical protein GCM10011581_42160 [Saccharopolyspora subtropica]
MDERRLEELFRDSVRSVPPATFDEQDVIRASRRITARRRMAAAGGTVVAAAVLMGGVGVGTGLFAPSSSNLASTGQSERQQPASADSRTEGPGIMVERSGQCGPDAQIAAAVQAQLPEAAGVAPVAASRCPVGARAVSFVLRDGAAAGSVTVYVSPVGTVPPDQAEPGDGTRQDGTEQSVRKARSGKLVVVLSDPDPGSPAAPYGSRIAAIAGGVADQF